MTTFQVRIGRQNNEGCALLAEARVHPISNENETLKKAFFLPMSNRTFSNQTNQIQELRLGNFVKEKVHLL